ncbi:MAG TPA: YkgJ family cysteine cluster protein [Vicinamibacteria bacterium]|nr:YkgJ family cysteine cluster protein [Vicinamibacteria bacterium]
MEPDWLAGEDEAFVGAVDEACGLSHARAAGRLDYGRGCPACCNGPFPINRLDTLRLRRGLRALAETDPGRAHAITEAAAREVEVLAPSFPGDAASGRLCEEERGRDQFFATFGGRPCPVLDPLTRRCQLYAHRPITCRTFGPPVNLGSRDLEACELCFQGSPEDEEACRVTPDAQGREDAILDRLEAVEGDHGETIVAFALARPLQRR